MNKFFKLFFLLIFSNQNVISMQIPVNPLLVAPRDIQKLIFFEVAKHDFKTNAHSLLHARCASKSMKNLVDSVSIDLVFQLKLVTILKSLVYHEKEEWAMLRAALCIGTPPAIEWLKGYLAAEKARISADRLFGCCLDNQDLNDRCKVFALRKLIEAGVPVNSQWINGETPLMRAVRKANLALVTLFIEKGCDVTIANDDGVCVWDILNHYIKRAQAKKEIQETQNLHAIKKFLEFKKIEQNKSHEGCIIQ